MKQQSLSPLPHGQAWTREYLIRILQVALSVNEYKFTRQATLGWLAVYAGDLPIQLLHAMALWGEERSEQALARVSALCLVDPEYLKAQKLLIVLRESQKGQKTGEGWGAIYALAPQDYPSFPSGAKSLIPDWSKKTAKARQALREGDLPSAAQQIQEAMAYKIETPLAAVTHLRVLITDPETPLMAIHSLAEYYHKTWPECLAPALALADTLIKSGQSEQGVGMLHQAATQDVTGQVARRLWGEEHPYRNLWPEDLQAHLGARIPASVSAALGWNQLPRGADSPHPNPLPRGEGTPSSASSSPRGEGTPSVSPTSSLPRSSAPLPPLPPRSPAPPTEIPPETLQSIQDELEKVARRLGRPSVAKTDGRFPVYVVFSTRRGLEEKYGPKTTQLLRQEMEKLAGAVRGKSAWGAVTVLADDASCMAQFGLKAARACDAWTLKLTLADLDAALGKKGLMIGALLIVGGPEVVPFHRLPNPVEDVDADVPSDNPYATRDENYFIPEWQVGRLPGGTGSDPGPLLSMLRKAANRHLAAENENQKWWKAAWVWLLGLFFHLPERCDSFGYAAEAWKEVSEEIFRPIGDSAGLITSPPYGKDHPIPATATRLGYFNLHGVEDNSPWYGQRDMTQSLAGPAYPIALRPEDIRQENDAPLIIFSEACYGAHLDKRALADSLALKFLDCGSQAIAGSTVTSYGSVAGPLIAADLLGEGFWQYLKQGYSSGEALQKSKIALAHKMHKRQGYLDGEDQKTLISFVLYGDPLASLETARVSQPKSALRSQDSPAQMKTVCDRCGLSENIPADVLKQVRHVVKKYLPGMEDAHLTFGEERGSCSGEGHTCPTSQFGAKSCSHASPHRRVVTMRKDVSIPQNGSEAVHRHYARVTFDEKGKVVKLAVSR